VKENNTCESEHHQPSAIGNHKNTSARGTLSHANHGEREEEEEEEEKKKTHTHTTNKHGEHATKTPPTSKSGF
jgi:hypothetical protein